MTSYHGGCGAGGSAGDDGAPSASAARAGASGCGEDEAGAIGRAAAGAARAGEAALDDFSDALVDAPHSLSAAETAAAAEATAAAGADGGASPYAASAGSTGAVNSVEEGIERERGRETGETGHSGVTAGPGEAGGTGGAGRTEEIADRVSEAEKVAREMRAADAAINGEDQPPFLPGLPDDLAWAILLRVPRSNLQVLKTVCRRWHDSLGSSLYFQARKRLGLTEPWLYASISDWQGHNACVAFDPSSSTWHTLPPIPGAQQRSVLTLQFAAVKGRLLVAGVVEREDPLDSASGVFIYHPARNEWKRAAAIGTGRWFCMFGVVGGRLYVAGGIGTSNSLALVGSVEAYDVDEDRWWQVGTAATSARAELMTLPGYQAVVGGCLVAKNIGWGQRLGVAFNPRGNTVTELPPAMVQGWQGPTASVQGHMFIVDFGDDHKLKAWDPHAHAWTWAGKVRLPATSHKPWAAQLVCFLDHICLVLPDRSLVMAPLPPLLRSLGQQRRRREREGQSRGRGEEGLVTGEGGEGSSVWGDVWRREGEEAESGDVLFEGSGRNDEERSGKSEGDEEAEEEEEEGDVEEVIPVKVIPGPGGGDKGSELVLTNAVLGCQVLST
ncbi:unnamed protein product [Closterium sp. NIES-53]